MVTATPAGVVVLTDRRLCEWPLVEVIAAAIQGGAGWVILRERDLGYAQRRTLADELRVLVGDRLIVAGDDPLGGHHVHLAAYDTVGPNAASRRSVPRVTGGAGASEGPVRLVGRSCHDIDEVAALSDEDYVILSPIYPTATKPGYGPALQPGGAAALKPAVPWLALGGIDSPERVEACARAGAAGVAVLGAVMRAADPAATVRALVSGFGRMTGSGDDWGQTMNGFEQ